MNERPGPANTPEEEALIAFADQPHSTPQNEIEATLRRVQRATGGHDATTIPPHLKQQIWEDLMQSYAPSTGHAGSTAPAPQPVIPGLRGIFTGERSVTASPATSHPRWNTALNAVLAAALILVLAAGIWRATGFNPGFGGGDDGNQPTIPFGGQVAGTPDDSIDPADLPTAEDCTVEPLTVDEVIWYIRDPFEASYSTDMASPGPLPTEVMSATPPATNPPNYEQGHPSQEDLNSAAETQRMWMACVLANSYFQKWALEDPYSVKTQVTAVLPPLTGEDEARAILEDLRDNGPVDETSKEPTGTFLSFVAMNYPGLGGVQLLDTDPANAWQDSPIWITAGYNTFNKDGTVRWHSSIFDNGRGTPVAPDENGNLMQAPASCQSFNLTWNEAREMWLVYSAPSCG